MHLLAVQCPATIDDALVTPIVYFERGLSVGCVFKRVHFENCIIIRPMYGH